jgi:hypothetical protein
MVIFLPSERNKTTYLEALREFNELNHEYAIQNLLQELPEMYNPNSRFAIVTTGSDGRNEKSPLSPIELILLHEGADNVDLMVSKVKGLVKNGSLFDSSLEVKDLRKDSISIYGHEKDKIFPTRALDSLHLVGNPFLHENYKLGLVDELREDDGKRKLKRFSEKKRFHRQVTENKKPEKSFNLETGNLFYDGDRIKSTKYAHLRAVQYTLAYDILKEVRNGNFSRDLLKTFNTRTTNRLNNLYYRGLTTLSATEVDDISTAYNNCLYWYHLSEEKYLKNCEEETNVDIGELKETTDIVLAFANRGKSIFRNTNIPQ